MTAAAACLITVAQYNIIETGNDSWRFKNRS